MAVAIIEVLRARVSTFMLDRGGLLSLAALLAYAWLVPHHIVDGDNAEFSTLGAIGGAAHPTGYPLYLLWLRALSWLPGVSPAHTAGLATTLIAAATILVLHAACRAWGARPLAATVVTAVFAAAPAFVRIATTAEVFALNCLAAAAVLWLAAAQGPLRGSRRAFALGLVAGLGLSNHMTCALLAPVGLLGVVRGVREADTPVSVALAALGLVLGLSPYAYLFAAPDTPMSWGTVRGFDDLVRVVTRMDYGGPGAFLPASTPVAGTEQLAAFALSLARSWLWILLAVALVAFARMLWRPAGETRWGWAALLASFLIAGPVLVVRFNIEPVGLGLYVCQRFYVLPSLLLAIPAAVGIDRLADVIERSGFGARRAQVIAASVGFAAALGMTLPQLARVHTPAVEQYAKNMLRTLPRDAVVFIGQDDEYFGAGYVQWALGERRDVTLVAPLLTNMSWYAARVARRGIVVPPGEGLPMVRLVDKLLAEGKPVFVEKARAEIISTFTTYPYGTLMKVLPRGSATPPIDAVVEENREVFSKFEIGYPLPGPDDEFATAVHYRYAATWNTLSRKLEQLGRHADAERATAIARAIGPRP